MAEDPEPGHPAERPNADGQPANGDYVFAPGCAGVPPEFGALPPPPYGGYGRPAAPKPCLIPLRPLTAGDILAGAVAAIWWNPKTMLAPSVMVAGITGVLVGLTTYFASDSTFVHIKVRPLGGTLNLPQSGILAAFLIAAGVGYLIAKTILFGLLSVAVGQGVLGRKETLGGCWRAARPQIGTLLATVLLAAVFIAGGWATAVGLSFGFAVLLDSVAHLPVAGAVTGVLGSITATVFGAATLVRWSLAIPVVMLERTSPMASLGRSWRLVRRSSWRVLGILLLANLIFSIASGVIKATFGLEGGAGGFGITPVHVSALGAILSGVGTILADSVTFPVLAGVVALLYTDLRMRRERLDVTLRAAMADGTPGGESAGDQNPGPW